MSRITDRPLTAGEVSVINESLQRVGLDCIRRDSASNVIGRNLNWIGETEGGRKIFVKRLIGPDRTDRITRVAAIADAGAGHLRMPELIGIDHENSTIIFELLSDSISLLDRVTSYEVTTSECAECASLVSGLHDLDPLGVDTGYHPLPPLEHFQALPFDAYAVMSGSQLEMWRIFQQDGELSQAVTNLRRCEQEALSDPCVTHGDLRLDQFMVSGGEMYLLDFEEARLGDPARDVGAFVGEWLYQAVQSIPEQLPMAVEFGHETTHDEIIDTGLVELDKRTPFVREFYRTYQDREFYRTYQERCEPQPQGFEERCAMYAGWHMLDRMLASAASTAVLSPTSKAAGGIGRTLLISPDEFTSTLGLE